MKYEESLKITLKNCFNRVKDYEKSNVHKHLKSNEHQIKAGEKETNCNRNGKNTKEESQQCHPRNDNQIKYDDCNNDI